MAFNTLKVSEKIKVGYTMERVEQYVPSPLGYYKCQKYGHHEDKYRGREVFAKCGQQYHGHDINDCELPNEYTNCDGYHPASARSCDSWKVEKEILEIKHKNNIPYHKSRKMVAGSKIPAYSHVVQRGKASLKKYEEIVKTLIRLEPSNWESFINEIKASLELGKNDTTRASEAPSAQTQTSMEKINLEEKTAIPPPTRLIKSPTKNLSAKQEQKKKIPNTISSFSKQKTLKDKQKPILKQKIQESETIETTNEFKQFEKMETKPNSDN